jgi:hypothetical protein
VLGQDTLGGSRAWHLRAIRAGTPVEMWVRVSDGYPLRVVTATEAGMVFTFTFDSFNMGAGVTAPPALEVRQAARRLSGHVGDAVTLNEARVTVLSFEDGAVPDGGFLVARPGNRFIVVEVAVDNIGDDPISTFLDWRLADAAGSTWDEAMPVREPSFTGGELAPGQSARGFLTYEVTDSVSLLTLTVKLDDDTAVFALD